MKRLYDQQIYPHLTYAITVWGTDDNKKGYIQPLIRVHKKIIRIITRAPPRAHTKPLMAKLGILTITNIYILRACTIMHPHIFPQQQDGNRPQHDHHYTPITKIHKHNTRRSAQNNIFCPNSPQSRKARKRSYAMAHLTTEYAKIWNKIDADLKKIKKTDSFKRKLKQWLLSRQANNAAISNTQHYAINCRLAWMRINISIIFCGFYSRDTGPCSK